MPGSSLLPSSRTPEGPPSAAADYARRVERYSHTLQRLDRRGALIAHFRSATFVAFSALFLSVVFEKLPRGWLFGAVACLACYVALAVFHAALLREEGRARVLLGLNERGLGRLDGSWHQFSPSGQSLAPPPEGHLYAADLDILGQGSLFQRLDETGTKAGERQLANWLLTPAASAPEVKERQLAVAELAPLVDFRQSLIAEARLADKDKADPAKFIEWAQAPSALSRIRWAFPLAHVLPVLTLGGALASANEWVSPVLFWVGLALQIGIVLVTRKPLATLWNALMLGERGFARFEETFRAIDGQHFRAPLLHTLQSGLQGKANTHDGPSVSARLRLFARLMGFAELRSSGQIHPIINALTLWDVLFLFRIDSWRQTHGKGVGAWFSALAQLEALSSFASWAFERPDDVFPEVDDEPVHLEALGLGHPLLDRPVRNDVALGGPGQAVIITGSNMSGKTTLMRAMGLNTVMALAGLPVCARSFRVSLVQVMTSMRLKDSLERGVSYFYAEVQRMAWLLETAQQHPARSLFFLDELFMGTNTKERGVASRAILTLLLDSGAAGAVATHDVSLCDLALARPDQVRNVHFQDDIAHGEMTFDYRLREGVVETTNALEVLRRAGIAV